MPKQPKCKICKQPFDRLRPLQQTCTEYACISSLIQQAKEKKARKELKAGREKLKSLTDWLNEAQKVFNKWIRSRDGNLCIACQRRHTGQIHAGHYRTVKAAGHLRFNEDNVHSQCSVCNNHLSGNITEYRINLVKKIGAERVETLENNNETKRWTIDEAKEIIRTYKEKLNNSANNN